MAIAKKEILYWMSCVLYGAVLTSVLLYIRFPAEKFHRYCERIVEEWIPEISCSIAKIRYVYPFRIVFEEVQVTRKDGLKEVLYEDPQLSFQPILKDPLHLFDVDSTSFGGSHKALLQINDGEKTLSFSDVDIKGVNLEHISFFHDKLDRKVSGTLDLSGTAKIKTDELRILTAEGTASVTGGGFSLKKPILGLTSLDLKESTVSFNLLKDKIELTKGEVKSSQLNASFEGNITIQQPLLGSSLNVSGGIVPLTPLYKQQKQLKAIVNRMKKKYNAQSLPYRVNGTVGRPTFVFGK